MREDNIPGGERHASTKVRGGIWLWACLVCTYRGLCAACARRSDHRVSFHLQPNGHCAARRWLWFPMPTFEFREWLVGLIVAILICFALTPLAGRGAGALRPLAWIYALIMFFNGIGHTAVTIVGHTLASIPVPRPAPGFYSSPFMFVGSVWLMTRLWNTASGHRIPAAA